MTLIETSPVGPIPAEQVYEIKTMAESGQFADALIRLRRIKPMYPRNTFLVALEKQLERLLVLPRDSEPTDAQKKELLSSLPGLVKGAVDSLRQQSPERAQTPPTPAAQAKPERSDRDVARTQLKEQYFQHADEYLKKGAYGSALVEIRRVKIIAPDDPTVAEYERTIRQLVELQQRTGIRTLDPEPNTQAESDSPRAGVEASPTPTPPVREYDSVSEPAPQNAEAASPPPAPAVRGRSRFGPIALTIIALVGLSITALALLSNPDESAPANDQDPAPPTVTSQATPVMQPTHESPAEEPAHAIEADTQVPGGGNQQLPETQPQTENKPQTGIQQQPKNQLQTKNNERIQNSIPAKPAPSTVAPKKKETAVPPSKETASAVVEPAKPLFTESDPQIVKLQQPVFPPETINSKTGGEVIIMVQISPEGKPIKTLVAKTTNPAYNASIITAVMNSTYRPGSTPNGPATKWITIPFRIM
jgi:hypothetical protein